MQAVDYLEIFHGDQLLHCGDGSLMSCTEEAAPVEIEGK